MPWICRGDTFCKPVKIDGVADKDLAQAAIEPLGFAGPRYLLSYKQANFEKGKEVVLSCTEERCGKLDSTTGDAAWLGNGCTPAPAVTTTTTAQPQIGPNPVPCTQADHITCNATP